MSAPDSKVEEKMEVSTIENALEKADNVSDQRDHAIIDKQTVRRLDLLLLPMVCIIYLLGYIDRANVGNARVVSIQASSLTF
jgi:hypothetical protein